MSFKTKRYGYYVVCMGVLAGLSSQVTVGADTTVTWAASVEAAYDLSVPGSILAYHNEVSQGGMNLTNHQMTTDPKQTDIAFDDQGSTLGARSVKDVGHVQFDSVTSVPDANFSPEVGVKVGDVYIVSTHDGKFAKLLIESVSGGQVTFKYALMGSSSGGGGVQGTTATYEDSFVGSVLVFKDPLSQGGINLNTKTMTHSKASTDIAFGDYGKTIGARSVTDMGPTNFNGLTWIPDYGSTLLKVVPKHVYVVRTHDGKYAKIYVKSILANQVVLVYAYMDPKKSNFRQQRLTKDTSQFLNRTWKLVVPGSAYSYDDYANNTRTTVTSTGAVAGNIRLYPNGTYVWQDLIDGTVRGKWRPTYDPEWPVILLNGSQKHNWKLGKSSPAVWGGGDVVIWDGYTWENGFK